MKNIALILFILFSSAFSMPFSHAVNNEQDPMKIWVGGIEFFQLWKETKNEIYREKYIQCLNRLVLIQDEDGSWKEHCYNPPKKSTLMTGALIFGLSNVYNNFKVPEWNTSIKKGADYICSQYKDGWIQKYQGVPDSIYNSNAVCLPGLVMASDITGDPKYNDTARRVAYNIVKDQNKDGSWSYSDKKGFISIHYQIVVLVYMIKYYNLTKDPKIKYNKY